MSTLNHEALIIILGEIWNIWAPSESIKRVGITSSVLSVEYCMQKEKFAQVESCIQVEPGSLQQSPTSTHLVIESPAHWRSSALYWKAKFDNADKLVHELNEKTDLNKFQVLIDSEEGE